MFKTDKADFRADIVPMICNAFDSTTPQIQVQCPPLCPYAYGPVTDLCIYSRALSIANQLWHSIQSAAMSALAHVIDHLDESTIRKLILPKTKQLFDINADTKVSQMAAVAATLTHSHLYAPQIQINILMC